MEAHMRRSRLLSPIVAALVVSLVPLGPGLMAPAPAHAGTPVTVDAGRISGLAAQMQLGPLMTVLREEGLAYGAALDQDRLAGSGGVPWRAEVARIYDPARAQALVETGLQAAFAADPEALAAAETFYASDLGGKVARLEVEARRAFLDPAVRDAATVAWQDMLDRRDPRAARIRDLVAATGLVDRNVEGTLNARLALMHGLVEGGRGTSRVTEADILAHVSGQQGAARAAAEAWLYPYMALAYQPLSDADFAAYADFLTSPAGRKVNDAAFAAFDGVFAHLSHDLGLAAASRIAGQDI
jgi:hypothetical protein